MRTGDAVASLDGSGTASEKRHSIGPVGLLLAAGSSSRFGADKRWHRLADGTPMALRSAAALLSACSRVIVVLRRDDDELAERCTAIGCEVVRNPLSAAGMGTSLACGVAASRDAGGWLVALADMPFIQPDTYKAVIAALARGASIARPGYRGEAGHPVGFSAAWGAALAALAGDRGARDIIAAAGKACATIELEDRGVLQDVDRHSDGLHQPVPLGPAPVQREEGRWPKACR